MPEEKFTDLLGDPVSSHNLELLLGILEGEIRRQPNSNLAAARINELTSGKTKAILILATGCAGAWLDTLLDHVARVQARRDREAKPGETNGAGGSSAN